MHEPVQSRLEEILQGRVAPEPMAGVQAHLAVCEACVTELQRMQLYSGLVKTLRAAEAPELSVVSTPA